MFPELNEILSVKSELSKGVRHIHLSDVEYANTTLPIHGFSFGNADPKAPVLAIVGGIHGVESIGTWIALSFIKFLESRLSWDEGLHRQLEKIRISVVPLANPVGMKNFTRCNGNGVDLMRNAPIESLDASFLVGGHFHSPKLPWFRGNPSQTEAGMEVESKALMNHIRNETRDSSCTIVLDLHSGFGMQDQLWFPYAKSKVPFAHLAEVYSLKLALDRVLPNHVYRFEPQAKHYRTHGDLWDYLYDQADPSQVFLPLTLELGSWNWVKKNPIQLFSFLGLFNPVKPHRQKRALRRHLPLFEFLTRMMESPSLWWRHSDAERDRLRRASLDHWF